MGHCVHLHYYKQAKPNDNACNIFAIIRLVKLSGQETISIHFTI